MFAGSIFGLFCRPFRAWISTGRFCNPGFPEPSVRVHPGLLTGTPPAFEQRFQQKHFTYLQNIAKQMVCRIIALPDSTQVSN